MTTATATPTTRDSLEAMVKLETRTLNWQRANDATYDEITATMERIRQLNGRIEAGMGNRPSAYQTNYGR